MTTVRDTKTDEPVLVQQIENDRQIGRWLAEHNLIEPPQPFDEPPHVGRAGSWVVARAVGGVWGFEVIPNSKYEERYKPFEIV